MSVFLLIQLNSVNNILSPYDVHGVMLSTTGDQKKKKPYTHDRLVSSFKEV